MSGPEDQKPDPEAGILISCPGCGHRMYAFFENGGGFICDSQHTYSFEALLLAQTLRVESLITAAVQFLNQQEMLVRGLAKQMPNDRLVESSQLESKANQIRKTIVNLRRIMSERTSPGRSVEGLSRPN